MKKLMSLFTVVAMSVLLASCGGGNATSGSGGASSSPGTAPSLDNSCTQAVKYYLDSSVRYYDRVEIEYEMADYEYVSSKKCHLGDFVCINSTSLRETYKESDEKIVYKGENDSRILDIINYADSCRVVATMNYNRPMQFVLTEGNVSYLIDVRHTPEANPIQIHEKTGDRSFSLYTVRRAMNRN